jgi:hypothetical protein
MRWITRERPKVDRIACPWLIRRRIDPGAEIVYVPEPDVLAAAERLGGHSFDTRGATYTHRRAPDGGQWCTFETLIDAYRLGDDPALAELARIVHAADIAADVDTHPFGAALRAIGAAGADVESDDQRLLERGLFVYDALYEHCRRIATDHTASNDSSAGRPSGPRGTG